MLRYLVLDIETIGTQREDVKAYIAKNIKHPATHKKPDTIEKWYKEEAPAAAEEAISRTGLDGAFGQVCCVGFAHGFDGDPESIYGLDEALILNDFNGALNLIPRNEWLSTCVVGFNVLSFDLRFLMQRYMINRIQPHPIIKRAAAAKAWDEDKVFDCMTQFAGFGNRISLDKTCLAFGIKSPKGEMDGSMVGQYVKDGRINEVSEYCKLDIVATQEVFKRLTFQ